jgi:hypothetical protein
LNQIISDKDNQIQNETYKNTELLSENKILHETINKLKNNYNVLNENFFNKDNEI